MNAFAFVKSLFGGGGGVVAKSCLTLATPWTVAYQAPLSMGFSRQEYWSGLPYLPPWNRSHPGSEPMSPTSPALAGKFCTSSTTWAARTVEYYSAMEKNTLLTHGVT